MPGGGTEWNGTRIGISGRGVAEKVGQGGAFQGLHGGAFRVVIMVVAQEVQGAVDQQEGEFAFEGNAGGFGLPPGLGQGYGDVAQRRGFAVRQGEKIGAGGLRRGGWRVIRAGPGAGVLRRKGKDVGGFVAAPVSPVQGADGVVVGNEQADLAGGILGQNLGEALPHSIGEPLGAGDAVIAGGQVVGDDDVNSGKAHCQRGRHGAFFRSLEGSAGAGRGAMGRRPSRAPASGWPLATGGGSGYVSG